MQLQKYKPQSPATIKDVVNGNYPTLYTLSKTDSIHLIGLIGMELIELLPMIGLSGDKGLSQKQCYQIAELLIEQYPDFTIEDVKVFHKGIKLGKFGTMYGRFDSPTYFGMIQKYLDERLDYKEAQLHNQKHIKNDSTDKPLSVPQSFSEMIDRFKQEDKERNSIAANLPKQQPETDEQKLQRELANLIFKAQMTTLESMPDKAMLIKSITIDSVFKAIAAGEVKVNEESIIQFIKNRLK